MWCQHVLLKLKTNNVAADFEKYLRPSQFFSGERPLLSGEHNTSVESKSQRAPVELYLEGFRL